MGFREDTIEVPDLLARLAYFVETDRFKDQPIPRAKAFVQGRKGKYGGLRYGDKNKVWSPLDNSGDFVDLLETLTTKKGYDVVVEVIAKSKDFLTKTKTPTQQQIRGAVCIAIWKEISNDFLWMCGLMTHLKDKDRA